MAKVVGLSLQILQKQNLPYLVVKSEAQMLQYCEKLDSHNGWDKTENQNMKMLIASTS